MPSPLLEVEGLSVTLATARGPATVLREIGFSLPRGDTLGLIGESGSGKSMTALALIGLLPEGARIEGSIRFDGRELTQLAERDWCRLRGASTEDVRDVALARRLRTQGVLLHLPPQMEYDPITPILPRPPE